MDITPANDLLVEVEELGVRAPDGRWIIRHVGFSVRRGEIVTLIGPNGGGKTTTVRAALGILDPDEGEVRKAPGIEIGYVPQRLAIDPILPMTVARFMRLTCQASRQEIMSALVETGVASCADSPVQALSGGEFQRVALARAIVRKPDLLVLDEPVQGVDFAGEAALYDLIGEIRDRLGCGILLISHDLHFVMAGTDHVVCINGHVCCAGAPQAVARTPQYAELFGPQALARLAVYTHHHDHVHAPDGQVCNLGEDCGNHPGRARNTEEGGDA